MNNLSLVQHSTDEKVRHAAKAPIPTVLTEIYSDSTNMAIWQRELCATLRRNLAHYLQKNSPNLNLTRIIEADAIERDLADILTDFADHEALRANIAELVDMFCCLFDLPRAGLRLKVLEHAMCPRFHVDRVPCRLVTTFCGAGTQWLPQPLVNYPMLGANNQGLKDEASGLYQDENDIQALKPGDVALLKGELWQGNEGAGLVHRSPPANDTEKRLLLTLDFVR
ncbi:DUF1826 domain-containing protein [Bowmanella pacifica]|uniref:Succinylglutamate desuccinylase n=1 Tax=Bowmanella pacifica TaxID=502051 RepID=A0A917YYD3_9ALTE|nr:DUF1826 domain-containing protein [Bowmanella pacifica]GGO70416.1 hypothetical protein GCM10010982_23860 [Bowmanella pacifica]